MNPEFEKMLDNVIKKAVEIGKVVKADAIVGTQMGKHKVQELDWERKKMAKLYEIGKKALSLHKKGKLAQADLNSMCEQVNKMEKEISKQRSAFTSQKKKLKKVSFK